MKKIFTNLILFIALAFALSNLSGCTNTANSQKVPLDETATKADQTKGGATTTDADKSAEPKKSEYPPISSAVASAGIKNLDGSSFTVADKKGKVLLLNLWATWCGPCRAEMPALVKLQDENRDNGFEIIGLNTDDESVDAINKFAAEMKLNYTLVWADSALQNSLLKISNFPGIPQSFLIDREGNLRAVFKGGGPAEVKKLQEWVAKTVAE